MGRQGADGVSGTYATTNIVIDTVGLTIWAEDFSFDTPEDWTNPFRERAGFFINRNHVRVFPDPGAFTTWLLERQARVGRCWMLGAELSEEERGDRQGCGYHLLDEPVVLREGESMVGQVGDDVHLTERPQAKNDAYQAAYIRKCRDEFAAAVVLARAAGLGVHVHVVQDDSNDFDIAIRVTRAF